MVVLSYVFMYTETKERYLCDDDCEKIQAIDSMLIKSHDYVYTVYRCYQSYSTPQASDTLCVNVKDTIGVNWDLLADTICMLASQNGLNHQKVFIYKYDTATYLFDTLVKKNCP